MRRLLFIIVLALSPLGAADTLKNHLTQASPGDYAVIEQGNTYTLLFVQGTQKNTITFEELTISKELVDLRKVSWKNWVEKKAPGAQSWTAFKIDLDEGALTQTYSYFLKQWMFVPKSDALLSKLLSLPLRKAPTAEQKRIGPPPAPGETDRRKTWKPPLIVNGSRNKKAKFHVLKTKWPADKTQLAGCIFDIYYDASRPTFPFPTWIEVDSPHYTLKVRAIDSGTGIVSPMKPLQ